MSFDPEYFFYKAGFSLNQEQLRLFSSFYKLLTKYNEMFNLTSIKGIKNIYDNLFLDSIYILKFIEIAEIFSSIANKGKPMLDLGSGGGFPGIPIKITFPQLRILLAEKIQKKAAFLQRTIYNLNLKDIKVINEQVNEKFEIECGLVITRAVEKISYTLKRISFWKYIPEYILFMKGAEAETELKELEPIGTLFKLSFDVIYNLPSTGYRRRCLVFEKKV